MKPGWVLAYGVFIGLLAAGVILQTSRPQRGEAVKILPPPTASAILVHVTGEVSAPGVVALPSKSRVRDAVEAAGGFTTEAEPSGLNLAALLSDGQKVVVPAKEQVKEMPLAGQDAAQGQSNQVVAVIDLNSADQSALESLPGIGPVTAAAILLYREQNGPFKTLDDLDAVDGIGPATIEKIKDLVTLNP